MQEVGQLQALSPGRNLQCPVRRGLQKGCRLPTRGQVYTPRDDMRGGVGRQLPDVYGLHGERTLQARRARRALSSRIDRGVQERNCLRPRWTVQSRGRPLCGCL